MRVFKNTNFDFIGIRKTTYIISTTLFVIAVLGIIIRGLQYGIDFKGGQEFIVQFQKPAQVTETRNILTSKLRTQPEVKQYGSKNMLMIRVEATGTQTTIENEIEQTLKEAYPQNPSKIVNTYIVGPRFANDLKTGALYAIITASIVIFLYVWLRFRKWTFSTGAVVALVHDVIVVLGFFTIFDHYMPFNMDLDENLIAALLTIFGYSINDTVVVFDRIRENSRLFKMERTEDIMNKSINQTLSRTIITSCVTLFAVLVLFIFGGEVLKNLSFALVVGIVLGTYSSIFVASTLALDLQNWQSRSRAKAKVDVR